MTACWHQNANTNDFITWASRSFAMDACKNPLTNVTSAGGKKSFIITLYWLIQWSRTAFHSACGLQSLTIHVVAVIVTPLGVYADGYAWDKLWKRIIWRFLIQRVRWHSSRAYWGWASFCDKSWGRPGKQVEAFRHISCPILSIISLTLLMIFFEEDSKITHM